MGITTVYDVYTLDTALRHSSLMTPSQLALAISEEVEYCRKQMEAFRKRNIRVAKYPDIIAENTVFGIQPDLDKALQ